MKVKLEETQEITAKRARKLYYLVWAGIIYSLFYTSLSLFLIYDMSTRLDDSCASRQAARTAIRTALSSDPDWTEANQIELDVNLSAKIKDCP